MSLKEQANKSHFTYKFEFMRNNEQKDSVFLCIIDYDNGGISVTNNIESIVDFIIEENPEAKEFKNIYIIYRDSSKSWDGYERKTEDFVPLCCETQEEAIEKYLKIINIKRIN